MFFTEDDPAREKYGEARVSHPNEYGGKLRILRQAGVTIDQTRPFMAYSPAKNASGVFILDPKASISALRHEFRHFLDDRDARYLGLKAYRQDDEIFWRFEFRAFLEEVKFAREQKDFELGRKIVKIMRRARNAHFWSRRRKTKMNLATKAKQSTEAELLTMLESESFLARASAMDEIGERLSVRFDETLLQALVRAIGEKRNLQKRIRGMITVSHVGMVGLGKAKDSRAKDVFHHLLNLWQVSDKPDLLRFLNSEGVTVDKLALV